MPIRPGPARLPTPPVRPKARPNPVDPVPGTLGPDRGVAPRGPAPDKCGVPRRAFGLEHEHADGRRQIGRASREASIIAARRLSDSPRSAAMRAQPAPKRILEGNAGAMSGDDERALDDARVRVCQSPSGRGAGGRRGCASASARSLSMRRFARPSTGRRRRGF